MLLKRNTCLLAFLLCSLTAWSLVDLKLNFSLQEWSETGHIFLFLLSLKLLSVFKANTQLLYSRYYLLRDSMLTFLNVILFNRLGKVSASFPILEWASILCGSWAYWRGKTWPLSLTPSETTPRSCMVYDLQRKHCKLARKKRDVSCFCFIFVSSPYMDVDMWRRNLILNNLKEKKETSLTGIKISLV